MFVKRRAENCVSAPSLHPIPRPALPWSMVGIDIVEPLAKTESGNIYIVGAICYLSKCTECAALPDKSAVSVGTICRTGAMGP